MAIEYKSLKSKMKAIVSTKYGSPETLKLQEVEKPIPTETEVLVKPVVACNGSAMILSFIFSI